MTKYIILPIWFVIWIRTIIVDDSIISPWQAPVLGSTDSSWICYYDSYPTFYKQFDTLGHLHDTLLPDNIAYRYTR